MRRLHVDGPSTRASLAAELGLNRSTIKALVDGLAEAGVVAERVPALQGGRSGHQARQQDLTARAMARRPHGVSTPLRAMTKTSQTICAATKTVRPRSRP